MGYAKPALDAEIADPETGPPAGGRRGVLVGRPAARPGLAGGPRARPRRGRRRPARPSWAARCSPRWTPCAATCSDAARWRRGSATARAASSRRSPIPAPGRAGGGERRVRPGGPRHHRAIPGGAALQPALLPGHGHPVRRARRGPPPARRTRRQRRLRDAVGAPAARPHRRGTGRRPAVRAPVHRRRSGRSRASGSTTSATAAAAREGIRIPDCATREFRDGLRPSGNGALRSPVHDTRSRSRARVHATNSRHRSCWRSSACRTGSSATGVTAGGRGRASRPGADDRDTPELQSLHAVHRPGAHGVVRCVRCAQFRRTDAVRVLLRHRARRIMIVCPAGLTLKWHDEMAEKFGLDFTDRRLRAVRHGAPRPTARGEPVRGLPADHRQPALAARPQGAAAARRGAAARRPTATPRAPSTCSSSTRRTTSPPPRPSRSTRSTPSRPS